MIDVPFPVRCELGEGPHWDPATNRLMFVDINSGVVHELDPATGDDRAIPVAPFVSLVVPIGETTDWMCASRGDLVVVGAGGSVGERRVLEAGMPGNRINDGKADPAGRLWCGTMSLTYEPGVSALYCVPDDGVRTAIEAVTLSNGLDWDVDRERMYYIDSTEQRIDTFRYDVNTGAITDRTAFADVDPADGLPDGLAVDAEGCVWVALFGGGVLHRHDPDGALMTTVELPVRYPTSIAFGGDDLATLFVTSSRHRLTEAERAEQPLAGAIVVVDPGVHGRAANLVSPRVAATVRSLPAAPER